MLGRTRHQKELEKAMPQREHNGGENRRSDSPRSRRLESRLLGILIYPDPELPSGRA